MHVGNFTHDNNIEMSKSETKFESKFKLMIKLISDICILIKDKEKNSKTWFVDRRNVRLKLPNQNQLFT